MLKFETNEFGIKRCIVNTQNRWVPYALSSGFFNKTPEISLIVYSEDELFTEEIHTVPIYFDTKDYYRMVEQEKDQITIFYFPVAMMFGYK